MPLKFTGRDGELRIFDGAEIPAKLAQGNMSVFVYDASGPTFTDKTSEAYSNDENHTGAFWVDAGDKIYVGQTSPFARIRFKYTTAAIAAGALTVKYYNGTSWVAISDVNDGTAVSANTFAQDGYIDFAMPYNWAKGGDASLSSSHYYVELTSADLPSTEPSANILTPVDGQFLTVIFAKMDFNGPIGRPLTEEQLMLNRGRMDSYACYNEGSDMRVHEPLPISFSCTIEDTTMKDYVMDALQCGTPGNTNWLNLGITTKGDTKNDGSNANPAFADSSKKTVDVHMIWTTSTSGGYDQGFAYYEVYFPPDEVTITEGDDGLILNANGGVYGVIENIHQLADRY